MEIKLDFILDKAGFPMLWVEEIGAYLHWLPVTKVQFETYMCAQPETTFDEVWYHQALDLNERVSPGAVTDKNFWKAFMTGVTPGEAQKYAGWCGDEFSVPSNEDWFAAYKALQGKAVELTFADELTKIPARVRQLLKTMDTASKKVARSQNISERTLAMQMMMRYGVLEWVEFSSNTRNSTGWGGMGEPLRTFHAQVNSVERGQVSTPLNIENRMFYYGFRLIRRIDA